MLDLCTLPGRRIGLSRRERDAILAWYAGENRWIGQTYFDSDILFDHEIPDDPSPDIDLSADDVVAIIQNVAPAHASADVPSDMSGVVAWAGDALLSAVRPAAA